MSYEQKGKYYYKENDPTPYYKCQCQQNGKLKIVYKKKGSKRPNKKRNVIKQLSKKKFDDAVFDKITEILQNMQ